MEGRCGALRCNFHPWAAGPERYVSKLKARCQAYENILLLLMEEYAYKLLGVMARKDLRFV